MLKTPFFHRRKKGFLFIGGGEVADVNAIVVGIREGAYNDLWI